MMFEIFLSRQTRKFLDSLDKTNIERITEKLRALKENPFSVPYKKVKGRDNTYRIRVGEFRVIYSARGNEIRVSKNREKIYERL